MLAYNPFSDLGATIPSFAMQAFLIAMVLLVIARGSARYDAQKKRKILFRKRKKS